MILSHYVMLSDPVRMRALETAVNSVVRPGDVVLDLGAGTGLLALAALRAGAARAYLVERSGIIKIARRIIQDNGFEGRAVLIDADWQDAEIPEPVDVLVTEIFGPFGIDECVLDAVALARRKFLKPGTSRMFPRSLELFAAPVCSTEAYSRISLWDAPVMGLDYGIVRRISENSVWNVAFGMENLVAPQAAFGSYDFIQGDLGSLNSAVEYAIGESCTAHGVAGWFRVELTEGISISTGPGDPPTHWKQSFFPFSRPFEMQKGDILGLRMVSVSMGREMALHWFAEHRRGGRRLDRVNHSSVLAVEHKPDPLEQDR